MSNDLDALVWSDATEQAAAIRDGRTTALALLDVYLDRIERYDDRLRAFVTVDADGARARLRAAPTKPCARTRRGACRRSSA